MPVTRRAARTERRAAGATFTGRAGALVLTFALGAACRFDPAYRDVAETPAPACTTGAIACRGGVLSTCGGAEPAWIADDDCAARGLACAPSLLACAACVPGEVRCDGANVTRCDARGASWEAVLACDGAKGLACRLGVCVDLCAEATREQSNVGCEYWAADLDNAMVSPSLNAASQQFALVVSNAEPDVPARVTVEEDDSAVGAPSATRVVGVATIAARNLEVFKLGPREIDGSADGTFNTGTGTALTRHAYRVTSNVPIVAYQFNPLENVNVFSNDASQLLPVSALGGGSGRAYVIAAWPQTIATSPVSSQDFGMDLRAFVAIVGTRPDTHVHVRSRARIIPGGPFPSGVAAGGELDVTLQPFDVLNLESGDFNADFTGTLIDADRPVAVFPGSEASDAPMFASLAERSCCADHLEEQATPVRAVGKTYALARMPNRSRALIAAGAALGAFDEPEYFRVVAAHAGPTHVTTTLPAPLDAFDLADEGESRTLIAHQDFTLAASQAVIVSDTQASQEAAGVPRGLPGGDPSLTFVSPIEQWRSDYVLLTPDKYSFDFLVVTAPSAAHVFLDGTALDASQCEIAPGDGLRDAERGASAPAYLAYRCQLSFPVIDGTKSAPDNLAPGKQNDGVHHVQADLPVGIVAYGFDAFVSYAYAGGTQLTEINVR
jgi:hypothetical protein